jgi:hypothetical protein
LDRGATGDGETGTGNETTDLHWRGNEFDLDVSGGYAVGSNVHPGKEALLDGVDSFVGKAGHLNIGADLNGLGGESPLDVLEEVGLDLGLHLNVGEGVLSVLAGGEGELEGVVGVTVLLVQGPANLDVEVFEVHLALVSQVAEDRVDSFGL